jgi:hypothetical protein
MQETNPSAELLILKNSVVQLYQWVKIRKSLEEMEDFYSEEEIERERLKLMEVTPLTILGYI